MHKRRIVRLCLLTLFLAALGTLLYCTFHQWNRKQQIRAEVAYIPNLFFDDIQQHKTYDLRNEVDGHALCLVQIDPSCFFCHEQILDILEKYEHFDQVRILFISASAAEKLEQYGRELHLEKYPKISLLHDKDLLFPKTFATATTPTTFIYARGGTLLAKFEGLIKAEKIIESLRGSDTAKLE